ncbi:hypothetical protein ACIBHX_01820 [Nonomuraea sp. NPDC050536]|uniref:hypothetical protein n=1 Tax=Nonomuraea sp. NPDC050536 TaxID=3364366 RepID=UPI0037C88C43
MSDEETRHCAGCAQIIADTERVQDSRVGALPIPPLMPVQELTPEDWNVLRVHFPEAYEVAKDREMEFWVEELRARREAMEWRRVKAVVRALWPWRRRHG